MFGSVVIISFLIKYATNMQIEETLTNEKMYIEIEPGKNLTTTLYIRKTMTNFCSIESKYKYYQLIFYNYTK